MAEGDGLETTHYYSFLLLKGVVLLYAAGVAALGAIRGCVAAAAIGGVEGAVPGMAVGALMGGVLGIGQALAEWIEGEWNK